jgi:hypothetical protein
MVPYSSIPEEQNLSCILCINFSVMAESDFSELLHAAEQLSAEVEGSGDLPKVERTLRQVLEASTELWSRVTQAGAQDTQAYVFPVMVTASVHGVPYEPGVIECQYIVSCGPGSSVDIATDYGLDSLGIKSRWVQDFPPVQTGPGAHPASCTMGTRSFPRVKCGWGVLLTTHPPSSAKVLEE